MGRSDCQTPRLALRAPAVAALAEDEMRNFAGAGRRRLHRSTRRTRRPRRPAGRLFRRPRLRLRREDRHRLRHQAAVESARPAGRPRDSGVAVHQSDGIAAPPRALGAARDRGARRLHRMDRQRQASPPATARRWQQSARRGSRRGPGVITHPEKVLFPEDGITKSELAAYYESVAPLMLPHLRNRPLTMERYPAGLGSKGFWQKDVSKGFPQWLERIEVPKKDGTVHYPL